jgi:hypothetical protein
MQPLSLAAGAAILLGGCAEDIASGYATVTPIDNVAVQSGSPTVAFLGPGIGNNEVKITMPDGEILRGEYRVTGADSASLVFGRGLATVIRATGDRGTVLNCEGKTEPAGHGSAVCDAGPWGKFRIRY